MKYIKKILLLLLFILIPFNTFALSEDYTDKVGEIVSKEVEKGKVNIYFFHKLINILNHIINSSFCHSNVSPV